jgi:hypothetical protein
MAVITEQGIVKLDFIVDLDAVADRIEPLTNNYLGKL